MIARLWHALERWCTAVALRVAWEDAGSHGANYVTGSGIVQLPPSVMMGLKPPCLVWFIPRPGGGFVLLPREGEPPDCEGEPPGCEGEPPEGERPIAQAGRGAAIEPLSLAAARADRSDESIAEATGITPWELQAIEAQAQRVSVEVLAELGACLGLSDEEVGRLAVWAWRGSPSRWSVGRALLRAAEGEGWTAATLGRLVRLLGEAW